MAQGKVTKVHFPSSKTKNSIIPASFWHPFLPLPNHHHSKSLGTVRAHPHTTCAPTSPAPNPARICPEAFGSCGWERLQYQRAEIWVIFGTLSFNKQPQSAFKTQALTILKTRKLKLSWDRGEKELSPPSPPFPRVTLQTRNHQRRSFTLGENSCHVRTLTSPRGEVPIRNWGLLPTASSNQLTLWMSHPWGRFFSLHQAFKWPLPRDNLTKDSKPEPPS